jgi:hypothetical protein
MTAQLEDRIRESMRSRVNVAVPEADVAALHGRRRTRTQRRGVFAGVVSVVALVGGAVSVVRMLDAAPVDESFSGSISAFAFAPDGPNWTVNAVVEETDSQDPSFDRWVLVRPDKGLGGPVVVVERTQWEPTGDQGVLVETIGGRRIDFQASTSNLSETLVAVDRSAGFLFEGHKVSEIEFRLLLTAIPPSQNGGALVVPSDSSWTVALQSSLQTKTVVSVADEDGRNFGIETGDLSQLLVESFRSADEMGTPIVWEEGVSTLGGVGDLPTLFFQSGAPASAVVMDRTTMKAVSVSAYGGTLDEVRGILGQLRPLDIRTWNGIAESFAGSAQGSAFPVDTAAPDTQVEGSTTVPSATTVPVSPDGSFDDPATLDLNLSRIRTGTCANNGAGIVVGNTCVALGSSSPGYAVVDLSNDSALGGGRAVVLDVGRRVLAPALGEIDADEAQAGMRRQVKPLQIANRSVLVVIEEGGPGRDVTDPVSIGITDFTAKPSVQFIMYSTAKEPGSQWQPISTDSDRVAALVGRIESQPGSDYDAASFFCQVGCEAGLSGGSPSVSISGSYGRTGISRTSTQMFQSVQVFRNDLAVGVMTSGSGLPTTLVELERLANKYLDLAE